MFEVLLRCYSTVNRYRSEIYDDIADTLNMKRAIADALQIEDGDDGVEGKGSIIEEQQTRLLSNIFGAYFKNNFEFVLLRKLDRNQNEHHKRQHSLGTVLEDDSKMDEEQACLV